MVARSFAGIGSPHKSNRAIRPKVIARKGRAEVLAAKVGVIMMHFSAPKEKLEKRFGGSMAPILIAPALSVISGINKCL